MTLVESSPTVFRQDLTLPEKPTDARRVVWVRGEHDACTADVLSQHLQQAIALGDADLVVDMSGVSFLDASTIGVVLRARGRLRQRSRSLAVRSPSTCARRLLELCDLADLIAPAPILSPGPVAFPADPVVLRRPGGATTSRRAAGQSC
jgi:anti-sigma B factor antagonist